jgi:TonB family protein
MEWIPSGKDAPSMKVPRALHTLKARLGFGLLTSLVGICCGLLAMSALIQSYWYVLNWDAERKITKRRIERRKHEEGVTAKLATGWRSPMDYEFGTLLTNTLLVTNLGPGVASNLIMLSGGVASLGDSRTLTGVLNPGAVLEVPWIWNPRSTGAICLNAMLKWYPTNILDSRVCVNIAHPSLDFSVFGLDAVAFGTPTTNRLRIRNSGKIPASGLVVLGQISGNGSWSLSPSTFQTNLPHLMIGEGIEIPFELAMKSDQKGEIRALFKVLHGNSEIGSFSAKWRPEWHDLHIGLDPFVYESADRLYLTACRITNSGPSELGAFEVTFLDGSITSTAITLPSIPEGGVSSFRIGVQNALPSRNIIVRLVSSTGYRREWMVPIKMDASVATPIQRSVKPAVTDRSNSGVRPGIDEAKGGFFPEPKYPEDALRRKFAGEVELRITIDASGKPTDVSIVRSSGYPVLDREAKRTITTWRWPPGKPDTVNRTIEFRLTSQQ